MNIKQKLLISIGFVFLLLGAAGVFLPVLPTTPFVLVATGCFSSNERLSKWLKKSRLFGEYITNYKERNGIRRGTVIRSLSFLWIMLLLSIFLIHSLWAVIVMPCVGTAVTIHILMIAKPKKR